MVLYGEMDNLALLRFAADAAQRRALIVGQRIIDDYSI